LRAALTDPLGQGGARDGKAGTREDVFLPVQRQVIEVLRHQHLRQQPGRGQPLVDDVRRNGRLDQRLAFGTHPLAANVALDGEHPGRVVQLLGHVLADALERAAAAAGGVLGLVADLAAWQVRRQLLALRCALLALALLVGRDLVELGLQRRQVGIDGLFEQAPLLGVEGLAPGGELQPLEHGHLVRDLVDRGLLERDLAVLGDDGAQQRADHLAQLRRVQLAQVRGVDHGT